MFPEATADAAFTRSSSGDSSNPGINKGSCLDGAYDDKGHIGLSTCGVRSLEILEALHELVRSEYYGFRLGLYLNGKVSFWSSFPAPVRFHEEACISESGDVTA